MKIEAKFRGFLDPEREVDECMDAGRAELLGGDFVINSSRTTNRAAKPDVLRLSSSLGPLCYSSPDEAASRGFPSPVAQKASQPPPRRNRLTMRW